MWARLGRSCRIWVAFAGRILVIFMRILLDYKMRQDKENSNMLEQYVERKFFIGRCFGQENLADIMYLFRIFVKNHQHFVKF
jgi:hypothetical protein